MIAVLGSSHSSGKTRMHLENNTKDKSLEIIDLRTLNLSPYDYTHLNKEDDFLTIIEKIEEHDLIILATPVYWYSMSAFMKMFIDRLSDLLYLHKDLGRKLKGKNLLVFATFGNAIPKGFEDPFAQTCAYFGINYLGTILIHSEPQRPGDWTNHNQKETEKMKAILEQFS